MDRHEYLQEQYEDALFALLMEEVLVSEGRKAQAENALLQEDPAAAVPEHIMRRSKKTIAQGFKKQQAVSGRKMAWKAVQFVAIASLLIVVMCSVAFATIPEFRVAVLNTIIEVFDYGMDFRFSPEGNQGSSKDSNMIDIDETIAAWEKEGYLVTDSTKLHGLERYTFENPEGQQVEIRITDGKGGGQFIDTEDAEIQTIKIHGFDAVLAAKSDLSSITIMDDRDMLIISILSEEVAPEELLGLAETMKL